jgi:hypothetical protein
MHALDGFREKASGVGLRSSLPLASARHLEVRTMIKQRILLTLIATTAFTVLFLVTLSCVNAVATSATQSTSDTVDQAGSAKTPPANADTPVLQVKELRKQFADLQARVSQMQTPRIIAAGTATFHLGAVQDNATSARVQLDGGVAARLGADYIVLLTNRFPTGGYPFFAPYWQRAKDGFDITLVDVTLGPDSTASYAYNKNKIYLIDWVVVKK